MKKEVAYYHLPGAFEFYEFYKTFLPVFYEHREFFYEWCDIGSIYGAPSDCLWGGGRVGFGESDARDVFTLLREYNVPLRLTFSNSLLREEHLSDKKCNELCRMLEEKDKREKDKREENKCGEAKQNGIIIHSDLLLNYLREKYEDLCYISSTTKVITEFAQLIEELDREEFSYVVPDFRLNKDFDELSKLSDEKKNKVEFLCNECCYIGCRERKDCYESVSKKSLGIDADDHICKAPHAREGYVFSKAMANPSFIGLKDIQEIYMPMGFSNFKIEGRSLGSALILEFLLYYMTKPEYHLRVRELIYLDNTLDLF